MNLAIPITHFRPGLYFVAILIIITSFSNAYAVNYPTSVFANSEKIANSDSYKNSEYGFAFQPPPNWTTSNIPQSVSGNAIVVFSNNNKDQIATIVIFHKLISKQILDAINNNTDSDVLGEVAREMTNHSNESNTVVLTYGIERYIDAARISTITSTTYISDNSTSLSGNVMYFLNNGEQYTLTFTSDESTFKRDLALFESSIDSFYVIPHTLSQNPESNTIVIPVWIKNNAKWWSEGTISDADFIKGIQYMIDSGIVTVPHSQAGPSASKEIPSWIKNNAKWWSEGIISDKEFAKGIEYLINNGMLKI